MSEGQFAQRGYRIVGRVQGVFFRVWVRDTVEALGLGGTVRNLPDGSVEAHLVGPLPVVEEMEARLWHGPPSSRVDGVEGMESTMPLNAGTFEILY